MQTFLPYSNFSASAATLDDRRLNKQVVEAYQILTGRVPNRNHPACLMWQGYERDLWLYFCACCKEYTLRTGKHHACESAPRKWMACIDSFYADYAPPMPPWLCNRLFLLSHRVNLLRKEPDYYASLFDRIPCDDLPSYPTGYYWPVEPVGKKAKADRAAWIAWAEKNGVEV